MPRAGLSTATVTLAGAELADEIGFDRLALTALAGRLGVRTASLYAHVDGLDDLRRHVALLALAEMADVAADAVAGRAGRDALLAFAGAYRDYARAHPGRYAASHLRLDPATAAASAGGRHSQMARAILRGYDLDEPAQTHAVRLIGSTVHGFVDLESTGGFDHSPPDAATSWDAVLDALDAALRACPR